MCAAAGGRAAVATQATGTGPGWCTFQCHLGQTLSIVRDNIGTLPVVLAHPGAEAHPARGVTACGSRRRLTLAVPADGTRDAFTTAPNVHCRPLLFMPPEGVGLQTCRFVPCPLGKAVHPRQVLRVHALPRRQASSMVGSRCPLCGISVPC